MLTAFTHLHMAGHYMPHDRVMRFKTEQLALTWRWLFKQEQVSRPVEHDYWALLEKNGIVIQ